MSNPIPGKLYKVCFPRRVRSGWIVDSCWFYFENRNEADVGRKMLDLYDVVMFIDIVTTPTMAYKVLHNNQIGYISNHSKMTLVGK